MRARRLIGRLWPIAAFLLVWELVVHALKVPKYIMPAPESVLRRLFTSADLLYKHSVVSLFEILLGFALAATAGFLLAVAIVYSRRVEQAVEPFVVVSQVVPKVALAPLFLIWFGHGLEPKIIIAATIAFFPVLVNTALGLRAVDREIMEMMDSIAATRRQIFLRVRLPNSLPYILPSLKVAALLSVVGAMVGEFVGADKGLGYLMIVADVNLDTELLFSSLIIVTGIGLAMYGMLGAIEQWIEKRYGNTESQQIVTL